MDCVFSISDGAAKWALHAASGFGTGMIEDIDDDCRLNWLNDNPYNLMNIVSKTYLFLIHHLILELKYFIIISE